MHPSRWHAHLIALAPFALLAVAPNAQSQAPRRPPRDSAAPVRPQPQAKSPTELYPTSPAEIMQLQADLGREPPVYPQLVRALAAGDLKAVRETPYWMRETFAVLFGLSKTTWFRQTYPPNEFYDTPERRAVVVRMMLPLGVTGQIRLAMSPYHFAGVALGDHALHSAAEATAAGKIAVAARDALVQGFATADEATERERAASAATPQPALDPETAWWAPALGSWAGTFDGPQGAEPLELTLRKPTTPDGPVTAVVRFPVRDAESSSVRVMLNSDSGQYVFPYTPLYEVEINGNLSPDMTEMTGNVAYRRGDYPGLNSGLTRFTQYRIKLQRVR